MRSCINSLISMISASFSYENINLVSLKVQSALFLLLASAIYLTIIKRSKNGILPPGPPRLPLLGNIHQTPTKDIWETYRQWHKRYGPIISLRYGTKTVISLGSHQVAKDLLDRRSANYSSRPQFIVGNYFLKNLHIALMPHCPAWKTQQKLAKGLLNSRMAQMYGPLQELESAQLLQEFASASVGGGTVNFTRIFRRYTIGVTFLLSYGERISDPSDPRPEAIETMIDQVAENLQKPANLLVELFPSLQYLPRFLLPWKRQGDALHDNLNVMFLGMFRHGVRAKPWNWSKHLITLDEAQSLSEKELAFLLGGLMETSTTTIKTLEWFVMACLLNESAVQKARKELDAVIGISRLPQFVDAHKLPYLNSFIQEVLRWRGIFPLGVPHSNLEADEYGGYSIPKGATILPNHWAMDLDDRVFPDAQLFNPDRWVQSPDLPMSHFGFGQRVCPGQHLARKSLYIVISRMLWGFEISHLHEASGKRIEVDPYNMVQGVMTGPVAYSASFKIRSMEHWRVIEAESSIPHDLHRELLDAIKI